VLYVYYKEEQSSIFYRRKEEELVAKEGLKDENTVIK
jgi:hypothetical protein